MVPAKSSVNSPQCSLCKLIVGYIDLVIQNNKSEAAIEAALEKICTIMPHSKKQECVDFVDKYGTKLVELLEKLSTPELVCFALGLCLKNTQEVLPQRSIVMFNVKELTGNPIECSICKYVVGYIDAIIQTNKSEAAIEAALEKVCTIVPHAFNSTCIKFIETYAPDLVELIAKYGTADQVCTKLGLCDKSKVAEPTSDNIQSVKSDAECKLCKYVISYINILIESNATEHELEKGLKAVCSLLPSKEHTACTNFVTTYGPIIPQLIAELDDPNVVCVLVGFCGKSNDKFIEIPSLKTNKLKSVPCNLCQYLVNYLDVIIQSNSTEVKFEEALDKACKILPGTKTQSECKVLVHLYGADLIKFLIEFGNPKTVCQELGICDK
jgi:saposin